MHSEEAPEQTSPEPNKRVNYAPGMVLGQDDFQQEQGHFEWKHRLSNLLLHGSGTVCGLKVSVKPLAGDVEIQISPGYAISPQGHWIWVERPQCGRLTPWLQQHQDDFSPPPGPGVHTLYVTLCYRECLTDRVLIPQQTCAAVKDAPSRILETFELHFAWQAPQQTAEDVTRDFGNLLRRVEIIADPLPSPGIPDDGERFIELVRNLGLPSSPPLVSPPDTDPIGLWEATACATLRQALAVWVTEVCPRLHEGAGDCLLLAAVDFLTDANGRLLPDTVTVADSVRPVLASDRLKQELICLRPGRAAPARIPYISTWLVLGPIFDPRLQFEPHSKNDSHPRVGAIMRDIDHRREQLDPVTLTQSLDNAPRDNAPPHRSIVRYGGSDASGATIFPERPYRWMKRRFQGLDWENMSDIGDSIHTHLSGSSDDDPSDPWNYLNFAGKQHALGFFFVYILSPNERTTQIRIRHDDAVRAWLNGEEIEEDGVLPFLEDHDIIDEAESCASITLRRGNNRLLVAVAEGHVEWGLSVRIEHYQGLRFTTDIPWENLMLPSESEYLFISIGGQGNAWQARDPARTLSSIGRRRWKGRVKLLNEQFKFVADGDWNRRNWGSDGKHNGPNFEPITPGLYEVIFDEDRLQNPIFILVKPFS